MSDSDLPLSESNLTVKDVDAEEASLDDDEVISSHDDDASEEDYVIHVDEIIPTNETSSSAPVYGISVVLAPTPDDDETSCIEEELIVPVDVDQVASHNDNDDDESPEV